MYRSSILYAFKSWTKSTGTACVLFLGRIRFPVRDLCSNCASVQNICLLKEILWVMGGSNVNWICATWEEKNGLQKTFHQNYCKQSWSQQNLQLNSKILTTESTATITEQWLIMVLEAPGCNFASNEGECVDFYYDLCGWAHSTSTVSLFVRAYLSAPPPGRSGKHEIKAPGFEGCPCPLNDAA